MRMFFSTPLAKRKEVRYNMTKRTKVVIFQDVQPWLLQILKPNIYARRC